MIKRSLEKQIFDSLKHFPVVAILGPRQVGKTTLAKEIKKKVSKKVIYLDLELTSDLNKLNEPELFLGQFDFSTHMIIIDEIQRKPQLFPLLRALIDNNRMPGSFLILGSASRDLIKQSSETLAGRIVFHELTPFTLDEVGGSGENVKRLWGCGGFPESYLTKDTNSSYLWREAFIRTYLERDIPQLGIHIPSPQLKRFWTMIAHNHGQLFNANQLAKSLGVSAPTVRHYLSILEETFIIRQIQPYYSNLKKRLIKSPKIYVRDTGLLHNLLMINTYDQLQGHPSLGYSWEGFVLEQILDSLPVGWDAYFYRTATGVEIDLILIKHGNKPIAVEVKYSLSPRLGKGFNIAFDDLKCERGFVINPGNDIYPLRDSVTTLPVSKIKEIFK